jgi:hypothetical protein
VAFKDDANDLEGDSEIRGEIFPGRIVNVKQKADHREKTDKADGTGFIPQLLDLKSYETEIDNRDRHQDRVISDILIACQGNEIREKIFQAVGQVKRRAHDEQRNIVAPSFNVGNERKHAQQKKITDEMVDLADAFGFHIRLI